MVRVLIALVEVEAEGEERVADIRPGGETAHRGNFPFR